MERVTEEKILCICVSDSFPTLFKKLLPDGFQTARCDPAVYLQ